MTANTNIPQIHPIFTQIFTNLRMVPSASSSLQDDMQTWMAQDNREAVRNTLIRELRMKEAKSPLYRQDVIDTCMAWLAEKGVGNAET